jgi:hypothetical protein
MGYAFWKKGVKRSKKKENVQAHILIYPTDDIVCSIYIMGTKFGIHKVSKCVICEFVILSTAHSMLIYLL